MNKVVASILLLCAAGAVYGADASRSAAPPGATVYFIEPVDGAVVPSTFTVKFGLKGMGVAPAGVDVPNTGHHHLLIDARVPGDLAQPLPATDHILHFGKGQTETEVTLPPGKHTLQLELGNYLHIPFDPPVESAVITVTVE
jgi:Domain of unknown function (DUF4399)